MYISYTCMCLHIYIYIHGYIFLKQGRRKDEREKQKEIIPKLISKFCDLKCSAVIQE